MLREEYKKKGDLYKAKTFGTIQILKKTDNIMTYANLSWE